MHQADLLTAHEAAPLCGVTPQTLKKWRSEGKGPAYIRISHSKLRYRREALTAWLCAKETTPETTRSNP